MLGMICFTVQCSSPCMALGFSNDAIVVDYS